MRMERLVRMARYLALAVLAVVVAGLAVLYAGAQATPKPGGQSLHAVAFTDVNVVDVEAGRVVRGQTLIVEDGTIVRMGDAPVPGGAAAIDGRGRYVLPGFWDMHAHLGPIGSEHVAGPAMVANGVLYVRDLYSDCMGDECALLRTIDEMRALQKHAEEGALLSPLFLSLASYLVDGPRVAYGVRDRPGTPTFLAPVTYEDGKALAGFLDQRGVDFIKVYETIPREAYFGLTDEARLRGLEVAGHLPVAVSIEEALAAGQRSIEHARDLPLSCSDIAPAFHAEAAKWAPLDVDAFEAARFADPVGFERINLRRRYREVIETQNDARSGVPHRRFSLLI